MYISSPEREGDFPLFKDGFLDGAGHLQGAAAVKVLSAQLAIHSTAVSPVAATAAAVTLVKELMGVGI